MPLVGVYEIAEVCRMFKCTFTLGKLLKAIFSSKKEIVIEAL